MSKRPITATDLLRVTYVSDPQISPDGSQIAHVVTVIDEQQNTYRSTVHAIPASGGASRALAAGSRPRWSPDGKRLAYLCDGQVWLWDGSTSRRAAELSEVSFLSWSPDGRSLSVIAAVPLPVAPLAKTDGLHHITRLKYKSDGDGYIYAKRPQLFVINVHSGETRQLTDSPNGAESPAWSPDGQRIGIITSDSDPAVTWDRTVVSIAVSGGTPELICTAIGAQDLSWSPDGTYLAFRAAVRTYDPSVNFGLWVAPAAGGSPINITLGFDPFVGNDRSLTDIMWGKVPQGGVWSADSKSLYFIAADRGENTICQVPVAGGAVSRVNRLQAPQTVFNFSYCPATGALVSAAGTPLNPGDLWDVRQGFRLTQLNDDWLSQVCLAKPEKHEWRSKDGTVVEGWVVKPPGFDPSKQYPAILEVHGGPYRQYCETFFHEFQLLAAEGYIVFYPNPRGTQGYGQEFAYAIQDDWGHHDYDDLMAGVDHLLALGYVDADKLGVTGGSYGGYMTNWIVTQTNRFKAAVTDRCVSNLYSFMGTSDIAFSFGEPIFGDIWEPERVARMWERSPVAHVANVQTPILIMHQMEDHACPIEQAEQFYVALKRLGRTAELLLFPGACHELSRSGQPSQRVQRLQWIVAWFAKHI